MGHWTPTGIEPTDYDDECNSVLSTYDAPSLISYSQHAAQSKDKINREVIVNNPTLGAIPINANPYYSLWHKLYKMNNNLKSILRHHPSRASAKHADII